MTRRLAISFLLALVALGATALPVSAQALVGPIGPGGLLYTSVGETDASGQVATAQTLFSQTVATSLFGNQKAKLRLDGILAGAMTSPGTWTITVSIGGISLTVVDAATIADAQLDVPWYLECGFGPHGGTAPTATVAGRTILCETAYISTGTTQLIYRATTTGTWTLGGSQTVSATVTFSETSIATGIIVRSAALSVGG